MPVGLTGNPVTFGIPKIGDLNNDGNLDIVVPNLNVYASGVNLGPAILLGNGDGTFTLNPAHAALSGTNQQDIALGDFNNDGFLDMIVQNYDPAYGTDSVSSIAFTLLSTSSSAVIVRSAPNPSAQGQSVTFSAGVASSFVGLPLPTGSITFEMGSTNVTVPLVNDVATFTTSTLPVGSTTVFAAYSGDANYNPNLSLGLTQTVTPGPLTITTTSLPEATQNTAYNASVLVIGGSGADTFTITNGSLPTGFALNGSTGAITGTTTALGTSSFTVQVQDSSNPPETATANLQITVTAGTPASITATSGSPQSATVNTAFAAPLTATVKDGSGNPISGVTATFTAPGTGASGTFAGGVNTATTNASGVATSPVFTANGTAGSYTVTASVSGVTGTASFALTNASGLVITTTSLPNGTEGTSYSASVAATGGVPSYSFSLATGSSLPSGLSISTNGAITGTPTEPGTTSFTVQAKDASSPAQTATAILSITIASNLAITTTSLPAGTQNVAYATNLVATGGTGAYTFSISSGSLPAGLSLVGLAGAITGTPTAVGTFSFTVQVKDSSTPPQSATANLSIAISGGGLSIATASLPNGVAGAPYSATISAAGGTQPYTFSVASGFLPAGLALSPAGVLSGTPTSSAIANFTVQVQDSSSPAQKVSATYTFTISGALAISTPGLSNGMVGSAYTTSLAAVGGVAPYTFSLLRGPLPAGLTINSGGTISGTPTTAGNSSFTVQVTDSTTPVQTATARFSITIVAALQITTTVLPPAVNGQAYSATIAVTGGFPLYTFSLVGGSLPPLMTLEAFAGNAGTLSAPLGVGGSGTYTFEIQVTDSAGNTATAQLSITLNAGVTITTTSIPPGTVGAPYSTVFAASGGTPPYTYSITFGSLPAGLSLDPNGTVSGLPSAAGTTLFEIQAKDSSNPPLKSGSSVFLLTISPAVPPVPLAIITTNLPNGSVGSSYSANITATGGTGPYSFSITSGSLPAGLVLSKAGLISGKPNSAITSTFTVQATDSSKPAQTATVGLSLTVTKPVPLVIATSSLADGVVNSPYNDVVAASGGNAPYTFSILSGALPAGLTLDPSSGQISGTPSTSGTSSFKVQVQDSGNPAQTATATLSIAIKAKPSPLAINTKTLPGGTIASPYNANVSASGGVAPYTFSILSGTLPQGLVIDPSSGQLSGTPLAAGSSSFTVEVQDSESPAQTATASLSITIAPQKLVISSGAAPAGEVGYSYEFGASASGGTAPYTFTIVSGSLPAGLTLDPVLGQISGTPTPAAAGTSSFTLQVQDSGSPAQTATVKLSIAIKAALSITTTALPNGIVGTAYSFKVTASGGFPPYTFSASGLPAGLVMNPDGTIKGTPTTSTANPASVWIQVNDTNTSPGPTVFTSLNLTIYGKLTIPAMSLPEGITGQAYPPLAFSFLPATIPASGGQYPYNFTVSNGTLPPGLSLSQDIVTNPLGQVTSDTALISGTPSTAGTYSFTLTVTDAGIPQQTTTGTFSIKVIQGVQITTTSLPTAMIGASYSAKVAATGGTKPYNFSVVVVTTVTSQGSTTVNPLPPGLTLMPDGTITGKTSGPAGTYTGVIVVYDSSNPALGASWNFTIVVQ